MTPVFFKDQNEFRQWLEENHKKETELIVGYYKVGSGKPSMTWSQSVDQALCFGWIDGIRRSIDDESYTIRFTPRKPGSNWSNINLTKVEHLSNEGLMRPSGTEVFNKRKLAKSGTYSFENQPAGLNDDFEKIFRENKPAWEFFIKQAPSYQRTMIYWMMSAKQEATKLSRLNKTIIASENHKKIF